ncbi:hypothetical protein LTR95_017108 [Oleoguttula sp. CCFEE 5521]
MSESTFAVKTYDLRTELFTQRSNFFKAALSSSWKQMDTPIDLTDHDGQVFEAYIYYVEQGKLRNDRADDKNNAKVDGNDNDKDDDDKEGDDGYDVETAYYCTEDLLELYMLADKVGDLTAANDTINEMIKQCDSRMTMPAEATVVRIFHAVAHRVPSSQAPYRLACA